jgi:hypothetical protein
LEGRGQWFVFASGRSNGRTYTALGEMPDVLRVYTRGHGDRSKFGDGAAVIGWVRAHPVSFGPSGEAAFSDPKGLWAGRCGGRPCVLTPPKAGRPGLWPDPLGCALRERRPPATRTLCSRARATGAPPERAPHARPGAGQGADRPGTGQKDFAPLRPIVCDNPFHQPLNNYPERFLLHAVLGSSIVALICRQINHVARVVIRFLRHLCAHRVQR